MKLKNKHKVIALAALAGFIPACSQRKYKKAAPLRAAFLFEAEHASESAGQNDSLFLATNIDTDVALYQAKLDIPFLFGSQLVVEHDEQEEQKIIRYETDVDLNQIIDFYRNEMERLGWQYVSSMSSDESVLVFQKPFKMATICLRHVNRSTYKNKIVIFVMNKETVIE